MTIVATVSSAAKLVGSAGGFRTESEPQLMTGQIFVEKVPDPQASLTAVLARKLLILSLANSLHPKLISRGGGPKMSKRHCTRTPKAVRTPWPSICW